MNLHATSASSGNCQMRSKESDYRERIQTQPKGHKWCQLLCNKEDFGVDFLTSKVVICQMHKLGLA